MYNVNYAVKKALADGMLRKRYRFNVLRDDGTTEFTIGNDNLVAESVTIEESMCSDDTIKFGLCEGSSIEFQFFGLPNIYGRRFQAFLDIEYSANTWATIPMGYFEVDSCSRQASTGIMKITAFNKLQSAYINNSAKQELKDLVAAGEFGHPGSITMYMLLEKMLKGYHITPDPEQKIEQTLTFDFSDPVGRAYRMYDRNHHALNYYFEFYTLTATFSFQLNTLDDYYRLDLYIDGFDGFTRGFRPSDVFIKPDENADPMRIHAAIDYNDEYGDGSLGDALHGTVKLVKAEDHSVNYFVKRCGEPAETPGPGMATNNIMADYAGCYQLVFTLPIWTLQVVQDYPVVRTLEECIADFHRTYDSYPFGYIYRIILSDVDSFRLTTSDVEEVEEVTIRDLQSAVYEMQCQFGQISRVTDLFAGVELNSGGLYPAANLYPSNNLYPAGAVMTANKSMYSTLWADEGNIRKWKYLIITYTGLNENNEKVEKRLQRTVNADGTDNYNMSDNWLFRNLVWTAEEVGAYADAMVAKMQNITWFPFEMWLPGLPYLETGDMIEVPVGDNTYKTYILQRTLKGIQNLQDTYINGTLDIF